MVAPPDRMSASSAIPKRHVRPNGAKVFSLWLAALLALCLSVAHAESLSGKVIRVSDGDTITVLDLGNQQHKIRLMGIDAPEKAQPFGNKSRESLASMIAGRNVIVEWRKRDRYGRRVGQVFADSHDVGLVQIERGMAWHYKAYEREQRPEDAQAYAHAELEAKAARRGLWYESGPIPPWDWRTRKR
jgi:endonuclease YncB( thermonuclease family)